MCHNAAMEINHSIEMTPEQYLAVRRKYRVTSREGASNDVVVVAFISIIVTDDIYMFEIRALVAIEI